MNVTTYLFQVFPKYTPAFAMNVPFQTSKHLKQNSWITMIYIKPLKTQTPPKKGDVYSRPCANQMKKKILLLHLHASDLCNATLQGIYLQATFAVGQQPTTKEPFKRRYT